MKRASVLFLAVFCSVLILAGLLQDRVSGSAASQAHAQDCPDIEASGSLARILETPEVFIGCAVRIEGVLEDSEDDAYPIRTSLGRSLNIRSWAPTGKEDSPYPSKLPEGMKTMSYFVGRQLRIVGLLVEAKGGGAVLEVSAVEDIDERSE